MKRPPTALCLLLLVGSAATCSPPRVRRTWSVGTPQWKTVAPSGAAAVRRAVCLLNGGGGMELRRAFGASSLVSSVGTVALRETPPLVDTTPRRALL